MGYHKNDENKKSYVSKGKIEVEEKIEDVLKYPCEAIPERNITKKTAEHFGVRTAFSEKDGYTPVAHYFPYTEKGETIGFKKRDLTKHKKEKGHFSKVGMMKMDVVDLFGTVAGNRGGKKVWITEGEYDAMICHQVLKDEYPRHNPSVLSIGFGTANAVKHIAQKHCTRYLNKFEDQVTVFDNDTATADERGKGIKKGVDATADVYALLPDVLVAPLPEGRDPCEAYEEIGPTELYWSLMKPSRYTPEGFIRYEDVEAKAKEMPTLGKPWPWPSLTKKTLGRRLGEGYYIGSGVKCGKSELANKLIQYIVENEENSVGDPQKVAVFKFEEQPDITMKKVAGKFYKKDFANPEKIIFINEDGEERDVWGAPIFNNSSFFTQTDLDYAVDTVGPQLVMYNNYGRCNWDELKGAIRHAVLVEHIEDIIIDPITRLTQGMTASEANQELDRFADEISKMSKDLGFTYYCFCHLKAPLQGSPHEFGGKIYSNQFTGSRAMMRAAYYMIGIERNKDPEKSDKEFNTSTLVILDDRKYGRTGRIKLFYDIATGDYIEPPVGFLEDEDYQTLSEWRENMDIEEEAPPTREEPTKEVEDDWDDALEQVEDSEDDDEWDEEYGF